jgi:uncharacterized LabA/DUF88 family protein
MADRVVVFLDYQNVYQGARRAFHEVHDPHWCGQVDPLRLARHLVADSPFDRELTQVRIYRGQPDSKRDPRGYGASRRQHADWGKSSLVDLIVRPLRYPAGWPDRCQPSERPQEKGVDVALALDFALMAAHDEYDVGILMSTDTDLKPALEYVAGLTGDGGPRAEVAAWSGSDRHSRRLSIKIRRLYCHWVTEPAYRSLADTRDYSMRSIPEHASA